MRSKITDAEGRPVRWWQAGPEPGRDDGEVSRSAGAPSEFWAAAPDDQLQAQRALNHDLTDVGTIARLQGFPVELRPLSADEVPVDVRAEAGESGKYANQPVEPEPAPAKPKSWILKNVAIGDDGKGYPEIVEAAEAMATIIKANRFNDNFFVSTKLQNTVTGVDLGFQPPAGSRFDDIIDDVLVPRAAFADAMREWWKPVADCLRPLSEGDRLARFFATSERDRMAEADKQIRDEAGLDKNGWPKAAKPESDREIVDRATATIVNVVKAGDGRTAAAMEADVNATIAAIHTREREAEVRAAALASIRGDFDNLPDAE